MALDRMPAPREHSATVLALVTTQKQSENHLSGDSRCGCPLAVRRRCFSGSTLDKIVAQRQSKDDGGDAKQ